LKFLSIAHFHRKQTKTTVECTEQSKTLKSLQSHIRKKQRQYFKSLFDITK